VSLKETAVLGCTLKISEAPAYEGVITIISMPSLKVKAGSKSIYSGDLEISVSAATLVAGGFVSPSPITGTIKPTAIKTKADNKFVLRKDDKTLIPLTGTGYNTAVPPVSAPLSFNVEISVAGQTKVTAE
jgi:hypothetical protein